MEGAIVKYTNAFVRQRGNRWQGVLKWKDDNGKWHSKSKSLPEATGKQKAEQLLTEWRQQEEEKAKLEPAETIDGQLTVAAFMEEYINGLEASLKLEKSTIIGYRTSLGYIQQDMKNTPLVGLTSERVQLFVNRLNEKGYSSSTVRKAYLLLNQGMNKAQRLGYFEESPCGRKLVNLPKRKTKKPNALDEDGRKKVIAELDGMELTKCTIAAYIALYSGMRQGEIAGLRWREVDLKNRTIHVCESIAASNQGGTYSKDCKTDEDRYIPMAAGLARVLTEWRERKFREWRPERLRSGKTDADFKNLYVCGDEYGGYINPHTIGKTWTEIAKLYKIIGTQGRRLTFHGLRHTFATITISGGADIRAVSDIMGHSDVTTTLNLYGDCTPKAKRHAIDLLDAELESYRGPDAEVDNLHNGTEG